MDRWSTVLTTLAGVLVGVALTWLVEILRAPKQLKRLREAVLDRQHVSLEEEYLLTQILARRIHDGMGRPDTIFAVAPGGAMIAEWLSRRFLGRSEEPIPIRLVNMQTERKGEGLIVISAKVREGPAALTTGISPDAKVLLVTDICRGGQTFETAHACLEQKLGKDKVATAALFRHKDSHVEPRYVGAITEKMIRFDWKASVTGD